MATVRLAVRRTPYADWQGYEFASQQECDGFKAKMLADVRHASRMFGSMYEPEFVTLD